jgi:hypothetical protein
MEHFEGDRAPVPQVARQVHGGHSTTAELALDHVPPGQGGRQARGVGRAPLGRVPWRRPLRPDSRGPPCVGHCQAALGTLRGGEQGLYLAAECRVLSARLRDECRALGRSALEGGPEDGLDRLPALGGHRHRSCPPPPWPSPPREFTRRVPGGATHSPRSTHA